MFENNNVNISLKWVQDRRKHINTHINGKLTYAKIFGCINSQMHAN